MSNGAFQLTQSELIEVRDCGQLFGEEAKAPIEKKPDMTGDAYEDFPEDAKEEFKGVEILKIAAELKDFGNKAFKSGDVNLGLDKYQKGLRYLNTNPDPADDDPEDLPAKLQHIRFALHSNSALLQNKLKAYNDAQRSIESATESEVSKIPKADLAKAYFRLATAFEGQKDTEEALKFCSEAAKLAPGDAGINSKIASLKKQEAEREKKQKAAYSKFFD